MEKEYEKLIRYHLGNNKTDTNETNEDFMKEVEKIKKAGKRLSNSEKALLLKKARPLVYSSR